MIRSKEAKLIDQILNTHSKVWVLLQTDMVVRFTGGDGIFIKKIREVILKTKNMMPENLIGGTCFPPIFSSKDFSIYFAKVILVPTPILEVEPAWDFLHDVS